MNSLISSLPKPITCFIRDEFMFNLEEGHGKFTPGYLFAFVSRPQNAPAFYFMTEQGAMWTRMPLHAFCSEPCDPLALTELCWWDCFDYKHSIHVIDGMINFDADLLSREKQKYRGTYMMTYDWDSRWAALPDQHKCAHMFELENGNYAMYPNNRILWHDQSWIVHGQIPKYKVNTHLWTCETHSGVEDINTRDYTKNEASSVPNQ